MRRAFKSSESEAMSPARLARSNKPAAPIQRIPSDSATLRTSLCVINQEKAARRRDRKRNGRCLAQIDLSDEFFRQDRIDIPHCPGKERNEIPCLCPAARTRSYFEPNRPRNPPLASQFAEESQSANFGQTNERNRIGYDQ